MLSRSEKKVSFGLLNIIASRLAVFKKISNLTAQHWSKCRKIENSRNSTYEGNITLKLTIFFFLFSATCPPCPTPSPTDSTSSPNWEQLFFIMAAVAGTGWVSFFILLTAYCFTLRVQKQWQKTNPMPTPNNIPVDGRPLSVKNRYVPTPAPKKVDLPDSDEQALKLMNESDVGEIFQNPLFTPSSPKRPELPIPGKRSSVTGSIPDGDMESLHRPSMRDRPAMPPPVPNTQRPVGMLNSPVSPGMETSMSFQFMNMSSPVDQQHVLSRVSSQTSRLVPEENLFRSSSSSAVWPGRTPTPPLSHTPLQPARHEDFIRPAPPVQRRLSAPNGRDDGSLMRAHSAVEVSDYLTSNDFGVQRTQTAPRDGFPPPAPPPAISSISPWRQEQI